MPEFGSASESNATCSARHGRTAARRRRLACLFRATWQAQDIRRSCRPRLHPYPLFKRHLCAMALSGQAPRSGSPRRRPAGRQFSDGRAPRPPSRALRLYKGRPSSSAARLHRIGSRRGQACDRAGRMGANSGDRIFSLLSEPTPDAACAQGVPGFSAQGTPRRIAVCPSLTVRAT